MFGEESPNAPTFASLHTDDKPGGIAVVSPDEPADGVAVTHRGRGTPRNTHPAACWATRRSVALRAAGESASGAIRID